MSGIWFDGRFINPSNPDGITSFSLGLIGELAKMTKLSVLVCSAEQQALLPEGVKTLMATDPTSAKELFVAIKLRKENIEYLVSPMQTTSSIGRNFKLALTLHDMIYYRHRRPPRVLAWPVRAIWWLFHLSYTPQRLVLNRADLLLTVSETSRKQIAAARLTKRPIEVIENATELELTKPNGNHSDSRYLVYMGSFIDYKNVELLVRAVGGLTNHTLVILSRISKTRRMQFEELAAKHSCEIRFENGVTTKEYAGWLGRAQALVSASKDEGFGIPVVEAMSQGLPVILSDIEIFREIGSDAALFFDADNEADFQRCVIELQDPELWKQKSTAALEVAANYSWESSAKKLLAALDRLP